MRSVLNLERRTVMHLSMGMSGFNRSSYNYLRVNTDYGLSKSKRTLRSSSASIIVKYNTTPFPNHGH